MKLLLNDKNLARQPLFWAAIIIPLALFLAFSYPLWQHSTLAFNKDAYQRFLENYKLPLYLLGTCVPLVAIIVSMHRTIQTEKQISHAEEQLKNTNKQIILTQSKNKTDSYYAHVKFITDALNSIIRKPIEYTYNDRTISEEHLKLTQPYALYRRIFLNSEIKSGYSIEINPEVTHLLSDNFALINESLNNVASERCERNVKLESLITIDRSIFNICSLFYLEYNPSEHLFITSSDIDHAVISFSSESQVKNILSYLYDTTQQIVDITGVKSLYFENDNESNTALKDYLSVSSKKYFFGILPVNRRASVTRSIGQRSAVIGDKVAT